MQSVTRRRPGKVDYLEWISRVITLLAFGAAALACLAAPLLAIAFNNRPFPGFLVEQTLVVAGTVAPRLDRRRGRHPVPAAGRTYWGAGRH